MHVVVIAIIDDTYNMRIAQIQEDVGFALETCEEFVII